MTDLFQGIFLIKNCFRTYKEVAGKHFVGEKINAYETLYGDNEYYRECVINVPKNGIW
jgi:hypothetical protein